MKLIYAINVFVVDTFVLIYTLVLIYIFVMISPL